MVFSSGIFLEISIVFSEILSGFFSSFRRKSQGSEVDISDQNTFGTKHHFLSGVVFTPEVRMKHVDRHWEAYPTGNKGKSPESESGVAKC